MNIRKFKNDYIITDLTPDELFSLLKTQVKATLTFNTSVSNTPAPEKSIILLDRKMTKSGQAILVEMFKITENEKTKKETIEKFTIPEYSYDELLSEITTNINDSYKLSVFISWNEYERIKSLIALWGSINLELIESCVSIDYKNRVLKVTNRPLPNGDSDKLLFFEQNNSLLLFGEQGPVLTVHDAINNISDILCN